MYLPNALRDFVARRIRFIKPGHVLEMLSKPMQAICTKKGSFTLSYLLSPSRIHRASSRLIYQLWYKHSLQDFLLKLSMKAFCTAYLDR